MFISIKQGGVFNKAYFKSTILVYRDNYLYIPKALLEEGIE